MGMMQVDDVRSLPGGCDVSRGNFLGAEGSEGERAGYGGTRAGGSRAPAPTFHGYDLALVSQVGRSLGKRLDDTLHATRAGPIVFREVQNPHCPLSLGW